MTGTAVTEEGEFDEIYKLDVTVIPTNRPIVRDDQEDLIFRSKREKYNAVIAKIQEFHTKGQPVLVGTTSVEASETVGRLLKRAGIKHNILNAKQHARESEIVKAAGQVGAVTVATNMAGRGTDIKLSEEAKKSGGLAILGTERHESRRIDLQLRGRSGRQGDPGESVFYVSLEDDLMRLFGGSDRITNLMDRMNFEDGEVLQHPWLTKSLERAQKKVEQNNFSIRKRQLEYDDVLNNQRKVVYARRRHALMGDQLRSDILNMLDELIDKLIGEYAANGDMDGLRKAVFRKLGFEPNFEEAGLAASQEDELQDYLFEKAVELYQKKEKMVSEPLYRILQQIKEDAKGLPTMVQVLFSDGAHRMRVVVDVEKALETEGTELVRSLERTVILGVIDDKWMEHLRELDAVKEGIGLRAYGQKNPLLEYKREAFEMFKQLIDDINEESISVIWKAIPEMSQQPARAEQPRKSKVDLANARTTHAESSGMGMNDPQSATAVSNQVANQTRTQEKIKPVRVERSYGRNDMVKVRNMATGELKEMKWKKAEPLVESDQWVVED
jgi:preprotein translocase subunit SecA